MGYPDLVALQEVQDKDGFDDSGEVDGEPSFEALTAAIDNQQGDCSYEYVQINPENNIDGGAPGGNIRNGYLYRDPIVFFGGRNPGDTNTECKIAGTERGYPTLNYNPCRLGTTGSTFNEARKPLVATWNYKVDKNSDLIPFYTINVHQSSVWVIPSSWHFVTLC